MSDLNIRMAKSAVWMVLFRLTDRSIGLVSTLILARLLVPADFGLVAMGMSVYAALEIMSTFSFELALIQNQQAQRRHYDTAWTFNVIFALANAGLLSALAVPVATFFGEPRVEWIMYALALCAAISAFDNIGIVAFQKDLELHKEFGYGVTKKIASFAVTVTLAFVLQSYWALIAGMITGRVSGLVLGYVLHPYRPRFSFAAAGELFQFSKWLLINNILIFINSRGIDFVVGKVFGPQALGLYTVAYEVSNLPTTELVSPISRAVFPGYSKLAGDRQALRTTFLQVLSLIALTTVPTGIGIGLMAEPMVQVVLGQQWMDSVGLMQVLALFGVVQTLHGPTGSIYLAVGKPHLISYLQVLNIAIVVPLLIWLMSAYGIIGAPWAILVASAVSMPIDYVWVMRELEFLFSKVADVFWRPLAATALMSVSEVWLQQMWLASGSSGQNLVRLLILVLVGAAVYVVAILAFWWLARYPDGAERRLLALVRTRYVRNT